MAKRGFLPCFSRYLFSSYPIENMYLDTSHIDKVKKLVSALIDTISPIDLCRLHGIGKEIQPLRPDSSEAKRIIKLCSFEYGLYRIDYGDTPFRIVFGLSNTDRKAFLFIIDTTHDTFSGRHRK